MNLTKTFYKAAYCVGEGLRVAYDTATGHRRLEKLGIAQTDSDRGVAGMFGGVFGGVGTAISAGIIIPTVIISAAPVALLVIPPAILVGLAFAPLQIHSLYRAGKELAEIDKREEREKALEESRQLQQREKALEESHQETKEIMPSNVLQLNL